LSFSFELAWPSFIKAFADGFRQDGSASPITTPNPFAVVQSEDIVDAIAIVYLHATILYGRAASC
jgi:hypothetical protein